MNGSRLRPDSVVAMKKLKVVFRSSAFRNLNDIRTWVEHASQNPVVAARFVARILAKCRKIGNMPFAGRPRDDLRPGLRTLPFERTAIIVYRIEGEQVEIIRIYYAGQNFEALLQEDDT